MTWRVRNIVSGMFVPSPRRGELFLSFASVAAAREWVAVQGRPEDYAVAAAKEEKP